MKIKDGASLQGLQIQMRPVLVAAEKIWKEHGQELVVTSGTDSEHSAGSLHYYGYAVDLRTRYFTRDQIISVFRDLSLHLQNKGFILILHKTHIHVEYRRIFDGKS